MRRVELILIAVAAIAGLTAAGMWAWTGVKSWKPLMLEREVNMGREISPETLMDVWEQARGLDDALLPGRHVHLPGLAAYMVVREESLPVDIRVDALLEGEAAMRNALAREPAHSHGWARLAWFEQMLGGPSEEVVDMLRLSIYTAPAKRSLVFWRIQAAGANRAFWDEAFEALLRRQIDYAGRISETRTKRVVEGMDMDVLTD